MSEENGADIEATIGGQQVKVRNVKSLNTVVTVATLIAVICGGFMLWQLQDAHAKGMEKRDDAYLAAMKENTLALKDVARAQRESSREQVKEQRIMTCVIVAEQKDRRRLMDDCERIVGR